MGMEFNELLRARHSVRKYQAKPVSDEVLEQILAAVRAAPTAGNFQAYEIYVIRGGERMKALADATFSHGWVAEAPVALVVCTNAARCEYDNPQNWALQDASIAATLAHLAAVDLGLGSCWVGAFIPAKVAETIQAAEGHVPLAIVTIGFANETPQESTRRTVSEFVHRRD
jgi:nitroreductase